MSFVPSIPSSIPHEASLTLSHLTYSELNLHLLIPLFIYFSVYFAILHTNQPETLAYYNYIATLLLYI